MPPAARPVAAPSGLPALPSHCLRCNLKTLPAITSPVSDAASGSALPHLTHGRFVSSLLADSAIPIAAAPAHRAVDLASTDALPLCEHCLDRTNRLGFYRLLWLAPWLY